MNSNRREFLKTLAASSAALAINPRTALLGPAVAEIRKASHSRLARFRLLHRHSHPARTRRRPRLRPGLPKNRRTETRIRHPRRRLGFRRPRRQSPPRRPALRPLPKNRSAAQRPALSRHRQSRRLRHPHQKRHSARRPQYAKKMFEDRIGARTYSSFDRKGYHFIILDSIFPTDDRQWEGRVDDAQLQWLASDLKSLPAPRPSSSSATSRSSPASSATRPSPKAARNTIPTASKILPTSSPSSKITKSSPSCRDTCT